MNDQELNSLGIPKPSFKPKAPVNQQDSELNSLGIPKPSFKSSKPSVVGEQPVITGQAEVTQPYEVPESIAGPAYTKLPTKNQMIPGGQEAIQTAITAKSSPVVPETPGFFTSLGRVAKSTFTTQRDLANKALYLQYSPLNYDEYLKEQVSADKKVNKLRDNPLPTQEEFNTMTFDQIKQRFGRSNIYGSTEDNKVSVSELLNKISPVADKTQQFNQFKSEVDASIKKIRNNEITNKELLEQQSQKETAGIPATFGEGVEKGFGSYLGRAIGTAVGSMGVGVVEPIAGPFKLTAGEIIDIGNKAAAENQGVTEREWLESGQKLDSNAAIQVGGLISSALEYVGLGKVAAPVLKRFVTQGVKEGIKKGIIGETKKAALAQAAKTVGKETAKGAGTEMSTEFLQSIDEQVSGQLAAGVKLEDININWADAWESGIQGAIGGGGISTVSSVAAQAADLAAKRNKKNKIEETVNRTLNEVADTGDPNINSTIDKEAYAQEREVGVPSAEQQGAATGAQEEVVKPTLEQQQADIQAGNFTTFEYKDINEVPEVFKDRVSSVSEINGIKTYRVSMPKSLADYELARMQQPITKVTTNGVLQVSTETPGAGQVQVAPQAVEQVTTQVPPVSPGAQEEVDVTVSEILDKSGIYQGKKGLFYRDPEGQAVIFKPEGENRIYEIGNIEEVSNKPISDFGIQYTESIVGTTEAGNFTVRGNEYLNRYSDPLMAINEDQNGNIVSVNLETTDGKKRTFRGNIAEDLAYQIKLKQITQNNEQLKRFEEFINTPEVATEISGLPEVAPQKATGVAEQVPTAQPAEQVAPQTVASTLKDVESTAKAQSSTQINELFSSNPELASIGSPEQYSQYLDTIFPDSKVKDIVSHNSPNKFEKFNVNRGRLGVGVYFGLGYKIYNTGKYNYNALLNIKNLKRYDKGDFIITANKLYPSQDEYSTKPQDTLRAYDKASGVDGYVSTSPVGTEYIVFEPEQIHILGSKQDIEGFKKFVTQPVKTLELPFKEGQKVYTITNEGAVITGTVKSIKDKVSTILLDNGKVALRANSEIYNTQEEAGGVAQQPVAKEEKVAPEESLTISTQQELMDLIGEPVEAPTTEPATEPTTEPTPVTEAAPVTETKPETVAGPKIGKVKTPATKTTEKSPLVTLNDYKRYFFNKFPKSFATLGDALSMSELGWQKAAVTFSKNATPEELKMLQALSGKKVEKPVEVTIDEEEEFANVSQSALRNNGYSQKQIDMLNSDPERYAQVDNSIIDLQTDKIVAPAGKKTEKKPTRPVKYKKTTYKEVYDLLSTDGSSIKDVLVAIAGLGNEYSDLAIALLETYDKNEVAQLYTVSSQRLSARGRGIGEELTSKKKIYVDIKGIASYNAKNNAKTAGKETEREVVSTALHEIVHAFTSAKIEAATGARTRKKDINKLKLYLKKGTNPNIKTLINLYLSANEQLKQKGLEGEYGISDLYEFIANSFENKKFQALLNELKSPIAPNTSLWKQFLDAIGKLFNIPIKKGSLLESVIATTPNIFITGTAKEVKGGVKSAQGKPSPARVLGKIANELVSKGLATVDNVVDKVAEYIAQMKIDLPFDVYDYANKIQESVARKQITPTEGFDAAAVAKDFFDNGQWAMGISEESTAATKAAGIENAADFLRDKAKSKDDVAAFARAWNSEHLERPISQTEVNAIWDRIQVPKPERQTQEVFTDQLLKDLFAKWAKGKTQGIRETQAKFRELLTNIQETFNKKTLTPRQVSTILNALKRVNRFSEGTFTRLNTKIEKILNNVNYAEKLKAVDDLKKALKAAVKSKSKLADLREVAKALLTIDTSYLDTDEDLNAYIQKASSVVDALSKLPDPYKIVNVSDIYDYINDTNDAAALIEIFEIAGQNNPQMENETGRELTEAQQERIDAVREMAEDAKESLDTIDAENEQEQEAIDVLKSANFDTMTYDDQVMYVRVVDNFVTNRGYSLLDVLKSKIKAAQVNQEMKTRLQDIDKKIIEKTQGDTTAKAATGIFQFTQVIDAIFGNNRKQAVFYKLSGLFDYASATARREDIAHKMGKDFSRAIDNINKKYEKRWLRFGRPNPRKNLREESEQIKLGMLAEFAKFFINSEEHISKIKLNIEQTISNLESVDKEKAALYKTEYDKVKDRIGSAQEAISYFQANEPHVYSLWKWMRDNMFTDEFYNKAEKNTKSVYNRLTTKFENYLPTRLKVILRDAEMEEESARAQRLGPVQSSHTKQAKRVVPRGFGYAFDNYISEAFDAYKETLHDVETSRHYLLFKTVANRSEEFNEITSGDKKDERNRQLFIQQIKDMDQYERNKSEPTGALYGLISGVTDSIKSLGVAGALGGPAQIPLQWIPTMVATAVNMGKDAYLLFARPFTLPKEFKQVLKNYPLVVRGQPLTYDLNPSLLNSKYGSVFSSFGNSVRSGIGNLSRWWTSFMTGADTNANRMSFVGFYMQYLKNQGVGSIDLKTEHLKEKEPVRQEAFAYATMMTNNLQTASATAEKSKFAKQKGWLGVIRNTLFPFASFAINSKIVRMWLGIRKLLARSNKAEGLKEITGVLAELITFLAVKAYMIDPYKEQIYNYIKYLYGVGEEEPEEEDKLKKIKAEFIKEINPTSVGILNPAAIETTNRLNYLMSDTDLSYKEFVEDESEEKAMKMLIDYSKFNSFNLGVYGIEAGRIGDVINSTMNNYSEDEIELKGPFGPQYLSKEEIPYEGMDETLELKMLFDAASIVGLPPEVKSASDKAYRKRIKELKGD